MAIVACFTNHALAFIRCGLLSTDMRHNRPGRLFLFLLPCDRFARLAADDWRRRQQARAILISIVVLGKRTRLNIACLHAAAAIMMLGFLSVVVAASDKPSSAA